MIKFIMKKIFTSNNYYNLDAKIWIQNSLLKKKFKYFNG